MYACVLTVYASRGYDNVADKLTVQVHIYLHYEKSICLRDTIPATSNQKKKIHVDKSVKTCFSHIYGCGVALLCIL